LGRTACDGGQLSCVASVGPAVETCANLLVDDDCNGVLDDVPDLGTGCDTGLDGRCAGGAWTCDGGDFACVAVAEPLNERCADGVDDDCDGLVDEEGCTSEPTWSECVNRAADYASCDELCASQGSSCADTCTTSRGFAGFGAEAWFEGQECGGDGAGQTSCDFLWDDEIGNAPRWRCCCQ
jgi:hypothetical protein